MAACSGGDDDSGLDGNGQPQNGADQVLVPSATSAANSSSSTTSGLGDTTPLDGCEPDPSLAGCVGQNFEGENIPLDIYIVFDQSASMDCIIQAVQPWQGDECDGSNPRITPVRRAVRQFLEDPLSNGIGVGLGFFGNLPIGQTSCDPGDYSTAAERRPPLREAVGNPQGAV
jgi:hypothetical protein